MERTALIELHNTVCQYQKKEIGMKDYLVKVNALLGLKMDYCSSCSALMEKYHNDIQVRMWDTIKKYAPSMIPQCPVFNSIKYNTVFWKEQFEKMSLKMIDANIKTMINEAQKLKDEARENIIKDIELLRVFKEEKMKPLNVVDKVYQTEDFVKMVESGMSLREVADIVGMTHTAVAKRIKKYEESKKVQPEDSGESY